YNLDIFNHEAYSKQSLYGSVPYLIAHSERYDSSILWMNSAETWVDIRHVDKDDLLNDDRIITWLSESGKMEFFIFGATTQNGGPKKVQKLLSGITGYPPLPPYFSLGFHYSKWEPISTELMIDKLNAFNENRMPVDVFWLDIAYTD